MGSIEFYGFRRQLEYKCQLNGSELIVVDIWFASTKTCSKCANVKDMPLL
ncbi:MAG: transposase [Okeania sp. SIO2D1]|nr:zinc ribbon domain-containing protein [Okeania sp. SIO2C9]NEQ72389.1 transposase [Okeania sp. SIO2C9]NES72498.1 transposase [Okeania sp. SIO2D1]